MLDTPNMSSPKFDEDIRRDSKNSDSAILVTDPGRKHYIFSSYKMYILSFEFWYIIIGLISLALCGLSMVVIGYTFTAIFTNSDDLDCDALYRKL